MFEDQISRSPPTSSPWSARLSTSVSTSASTTAPPTPPSHHPFVTNTTYVDTTSAKQFNASDHQMPALHLLNMSCDETLSDTSDEADGFFSLEMDVSIDQQLQHHDSPHIHNDVPSSAQTAPPPILSLSHRFDPDPQRNNFRVSAASPILHPAVRRASETLAYSSSPLQHVGLDPIMASRSRNSPVLNEAAAAAAVGGGGVGGNNHKVSNAANIDAHNASPPSSFSPIPPEVDQKGNLEYKLKILPPSRERFDRLVTQLKWRLLEGGGLAVYEIGVLDDGTLIGLDSDSMKDSLKLLSLMAAEVGAHCFVQRVLALEKVSSSTTEHVATNGSDNVSQHVVGQHQPLNSASSQTATSHLAAAAAKSDLSLRALASHEATHMLQPYVLTACMDENARADLLHTGSAGLFRFKIAEQQTSIPPPLANIDGDASAASTPSVAAVDPVDSAAFTATQDDAGMAMSAQTKRRLLKATNNLPSKNGSNSNGDATLSRAKKDILKGLDQSAIVYLPSKEEKRILRAAEAAAGEAAAAAQEDTAAVERALSHTETQERNMMTKMTRVADCVQPKTARARARARKLAGHGGCGNDSTSTPSYLESSFSPTPLPATKGVNATITKTTATIHNSAAGAYAGYENVMSAFGVLSERAARTLLGPNIGPNINDGDTDCNHVEQCAVNTARLIVEAVVRRDTNLEHNFGDFQAVRE
ncbi:uncharacterized protein MEPE_05448 [Melanopsichium pennsylvanicum]|uniref:Uncharacterized protein n=2 Tax=Melanopsichium pennsylvanicum TaxID=63383 RepID=A0AAJ4XPH1_9BASI